MTDRTSTQIPEIEIKHLKFKFSVFEALCERLKKLSVLYDIF